MEHCYWSGTGKYQDFVNELDQKIPSIGYTCNPYMNLYLTMCHLYCDAYNNGGWNIKDCYQGDFERNVAPYLTGISTRPFIDQNFEKMEQMIDKALEFIKDKDLSFPVYTVWLNHDEHTLSRIHPPQNVINSWEAVTFGAENEMMDYCESRVGSAISRDVTDEMLALEWGNAETPSLDDQIKAALEASKEQTGQELSPELEAALHQNLKDVMQSNIGR